MVLVEGKANLPQIIGTPGARGRGACHLHRGQYEARKYRYEQDYNQYLDQCKPASEARQPRHAKAGVHCWQILGFPAGLKAATFTGSLP
jgi:hypothetical protein